MNLKKLLPNIPLILFLSTGAIVTQPQIAAAQADSDALKKLVAGEVTDFITSIPIPDFITDIFQDFHSIVGSLQTFLSKRGVEIETGEIGLPDIEQAEILFTEDASLDRLSDLYGSQTGSTFANKDKLLEQYIRELSREYSENSALSLEGQEIIDEKITSAYETTKTSNELSADSQTQDVSQNILRNISGQLNLQQQLDYMAFFETQEDKVARSLQLELNSEALTEISRQTTRNEREAFAANRDALDSIYSITIPGQRD